MKKQVTMKNTVRNAALAACAALVAAACAKETDVTGPLPEESSDVTYVEIPFTAGLPATKTVLENGEGQERIVKWVKDDEVTIFYGDGKSVTAQAQESGETTTLVAKVPAGDVAAFNAATTYYAVSPASVGATLADGALTLTLTQSKGYPVGDGSFAQADVCVATTGASEKAFTFHHSVSLLKFETVRTDVASVQVVSGSSGTLTADVKATFNTDGTLKAVSNVSGTTSRNCNFTFATPGAGTWFLPVFPGANLKAGIAIQYTLTDGSVLPAAVSAKARTIERGHILNMGQPETKMVTDYYFTETGEGNGQTWATAGGAALLRTLFDQDALASDFDASLTDAEKTQSAANLLAVKLRGTTFHFAKGDYVLSTDDAPLFCIDLSNGTWTGEYPFTFKGGYPADGGEDSTIDLKNNLTRFTGNETYGILYLNGNKSVPSLTVEGVQFINGREQTLVEGTTGGVNGGGALNIAKAKVTLTGCTLSGNQASNGGGAIKMTHNDGVLKLTGCTLSNNADNGNDAKQGGGALCLRGGTAYVKGCYFETNSSSIRGGAINQPNDGGIGYLYMTDCRFSENTTSGLGASLYNNGTNNNTLIFNSSFRAPKNESSQGFVINTNKNTLIANSTVNGKYTNTSGTPNRGAVKDGITKDGYAFMLVNDILFDNNKTQPVIWSNNGTPGTLLYYNVLNKALTKGDEDKFVYGADNAADENYALNRISSTSSAYLNCLYPSKSLPDGFTKITQEQLEEKMLSFTPTRGTADGIAAKFVAWLKEVGSWDKDIKGDPRPESGYYPGCYEVQ